METEPNTIISFSHWGEYDGESRDNTITLNGDKAEYLPHILNGFLSFLRAVGFTYIHNIQALTEDGKVYLDAQDI